MNSEPRDASSDRPKLATGPEALPKLTISPSGARQSSEPVNVSLPIESYTTDTPLPPVTTLKVGDRVAYAAGVPQGSYSEVRNLPADKLLVLPDKIDYDTAAAMMLQGLTVHYLLHRTAALKAGDTVLFHAAAGGIGLIACQWAKVLGVNLIGTVGSDEKAALATAHGAAHVINYNTEDFVDRVREITGGKGVSVVYDSIGKDTFIGSLDCLAPLGMMVSFGNASGPVPAFTLSELASRGDASLAAMDGLRRVIRVGSFSKTLSPVPAGK